MKRAIAMKCNQKQWDAIKNKLVGLELQCCTDFERHNYLVNNSFCKSDFICNYDNSCKKDYNREVHETWNEQVFLEACGIETEKTFKGSELQFLDGDIWIQANSETSRYRIKPDYSKEIAELERQIQILKNK